MFEVKMMWLHPELADFEAEAWSLGQEGCQGGTEDDTWLQTSQNEWQITTVSKYVKVSKSSDFDKSVLGRSCWPRKLLCRPLREGRLIVCGLRTDRCMGLRYQVWQAATIRNHCLRSNHFLYFFHVYPFVISSISSMSIRLCHFVSMSDSHWVMPCFWESDGSLETASEQVALQRRVTFLDEESAINWERRNM